MTSKIGSDSSSRSSDRGLLFLLNTFFESNMYRSQVICVTSMVKMAVRRFQPLWSVPTRNLCHQSIVRPRFPISVQNMIRVYRVPFSRKKRFSSGGYLRLIDNAAGGLLNWKWHHQSIPRPSILISVQYMFSLSCTIDKLHAFSQW
jgi:hypothetical protein